MCVPLPNAVGVYVTAHVAVAPVPLKVHGSPVNVPVPPEVKLTVPVGVLGGLLTSVTVAVHVVETPTLTLLGLQLTVVVVSSFGWSAMSVVPLLVAWVSSPPY